MDTIITPPGAEQLERQVFAHIPLAIAMRIRVEDYRPGRLVLAARFEGQLLQLLYNRGDCGVRVARTQGGSDALTLNPQ